MKKSFSSKVDDRSSNQEATLPYFMRPEDSLQPSQKSATGPHPEVI
jgi:hypothetical protein